MSELDPNPKSALGDQMPKVSVVDCSDDGIEEGLRKALDLVDGLSNIKGRKTVSIKPNLCQPNSAFSGATTDVRIVRALIEIIDSTMSCNINIVETNNFKATADETFKHLGYKDLAESYDNVQCINLSNDSRVRVMIDGSVFSSILVPESMLFSDCLISVAKLKTSADYLYTGVLKNQFGLLLSTAQRSQYHGFMSRVLADLNKLYMPDLSIIDGVIGMEGFGPTDGTPKHAGVLIASKDPVAADAVAARIMGLEPSRIGYLRYAQKQGIGTLDDITIVGSEIDETVRTPFTQIAARYYYLSRVALAFQRYARQLRNFAEFVRLTRSALSTVGLSAIERRMSYSGLWRLATDTLFKLQE